MGTVNLTAQEVGESIGGIIDGDTTAIVSELSKIDSYQENSLTFLANMIYLDHIYADISRVVIVPQNLQISKPPSVTLIRVDNVYESFALVASRFARDSLVPSEEKDPPNDMSSNIDSDVKIGAYSVVHVSSHIAKGTVVGDQVYIGSNVSIGKNCRIHHGVKVYHDVTIGDNCIIYANAVIGSDGFGHARTTNSYIKVPQLGKVILEDDVEIGANTVIDRATLGATIIRRGVKLDNLIQVAHGVEIGENTVIAAQSGISGSSKIGANSMIGGQVGIAGHLHIAEKSQIQAKSGVASHIEVPNKKWYGYPITTYMGYLRSYSLFRKLPELLERIKRLEDKVE